MTQMNLKLEKHQQRCIKEQKTHLHIGIKWYKRFLDGHLIVEDDFKQKWRPSLHASKDECDEMRNIINVDQRLWKLQKNGVNLNFYDTIWYKINVNCTWHGTKSDLLAGFWIHETLPYNPDLIQLDFAVFPYIKLFYNLIKISPFISLSVCFCRSWKDLTRPRFNNGLRI